MLGVGKVASERKELGRNRSVGGKEKGQGRGLFFGAGARVNRIESGEDEVGKVGLLV